MFLTLKFIGPKTLYTVTAKKVQCIYVLIVPNHIMTTIKSVECEIFNNYIFVFSDHCTIGYAIFCKV